METKRVTNRLPSPPPKNTNTVVYQVPKNELRPTSRVSEPLSVIHTSTRLRCNGGNAELATTSQHTCYYHPCTSAVWPCDPCEQRCTPVLWRSDTCPHHNTFLILGSRGYHSIAPQSNRKLFDIPFRRCTRGGYRQYNYPRNRTTDSRFCLCSPLY